MSIEPARGVVVITQRVDVWADRGERRDALDQRLSALVWVAGWAPVSIPNLSLSSETPSQWVGSWLQAVRPVAIVLSGGNDIGDASERDGTESVLLDYASARRLPVLGICRGMQMMAFWAGGKLRRVANHVRTRHRLDVVAGSGPWPTEVDSYHAIGLDGCPASFEVLATARDGEIEAMRHRALPWEAWMWHPEREAALTDFSVTRMLRLFRA